MPATLGSAISLPWLGRTLDVMPGWKVVRFTMPGLALACVLIAVAPNIVVLTVALYLLRLLGLGMMTETAFTETGRWFVANRGRAMALIVPGQHAGLAVLPVLVVLVDRATAGWRTAWIASAALILLVGMPAIIALMKVERVPRSHLLGALWPEVYGLANLGGIRAIIVSAMVISTAVGPGLSGALIDRGISMPKQMLWLSGWCVAACFVLAFAAWRVRLRASGAAPPASALA